MKVGQDLEHYSMTFFMLMSEDNGKAQGMDLNVQYRHDCVYYRGKSGTWKGGLILESDMKNKVSPKTDPGNESDAPCADCGKKFKCKSNLDRHRVTLVLDTPLVAYVENGLLT